MTENEISGDVLDAAIKTYLVIMKLHLGLVVNFGMETLRDGYARVVNGYA